MNKIISTKERILNLQVGPSGSVILHLVFDWIKIESFHQILTKISIFINNINIFMEKSKEKSQLYPRI